MHEPHQKGKITSNEMFIYIYITKNFKNQRIKYIRTHFAYYFWRSRRSGGASGQVRPSRRALLAVSGRRTGARRPMGGGAAPPPGLGQSVLYTWPALE